MLRLNRIIALGESASGFDRKFLHRMQRRLFITALFAAFGIAVCPAQAAQRGILLLAHGQHTMPMEGAHANMDMGQPLWNQNVNVVARELDKSEPTEIAFGMAEVPAIQGAIDRLQKRGVTTIVAVPLFISSHSPIIGNFRYILGLSPTLPSTTSIKHLGKVMHTAKIVMANAMDADPIISEILLGRAKSAAALNSPTTTIVLIAHGPNDDAENQLWLTDLETHAAFLKAHGFHEVKGITRRDDAPPAIKDKALTEFRALVQTGDSVGQVVVVPVLLSEGGIEDELKEDLKGLSFTFTKPLLPDPKIAQWVLKQADEATRH